MGIGHSHDHADDHAHGHGSHGHSHAPADFGQAFLIGIILNTGFVIVEAAYGWISGSMALIADAGHNLSDVLALLLAWGASIAAKKPPTQRFTYGYKSSTILAALANAGLLLVAIGAIAFETIQRIAEPAPVEGMTQSAVEQLDPAARQEELARMLGGVEVSQEARAAAKRLLADAG